MVEVLNIKIILDYIMSLGSLHHNVALWIHILLLCLVLDLFVSRSSKEYGCCHNPNLGLVTKVRAYKGAGQEGSSGVTSYTPKSAKECEGMNLHTPKELPFWELESRWTSKFLEGNCKGQNPMDWKFLYIIGKLLKRRCLKWARMTHLDT
jgi:hypothetical protein